MKRTLLSTASLLALHAAASAQVSGFTAVPAHPGPGINLAWTAGTTDPVTIHRWVDGQGNYSPITTATGGSYTDTTAAVNTLYYYAVQQGASRSPAAQAVVADATQPFVCPYVQPVDSSLIGQDRTASFVSANGTLTTVTVHAPVTTLTVTVPPCNGAGGCDDQTNINAAILPGKKVLLQAGDYFINPPNSGNPFNINFNVASDQILQGAGKVMKAGDVGTVLHFNLPPNLGTAYGFSFPGGARNMVRDLTVMWKPINALPGVVTTSGGNQRFTVNNPTYYIPNPASPPINVFSSNGYNTTNFAFDMRTGSRTGVLGTFNTNFAMDGLYYYLFIGIHYPNNTPAIMWVNQTRETFHIADAADTTIANVAAFGGSGPVITDVEIGTNSAGSLWVVNSNITRKPDSLLSSGEQPSYVAAFGDNDINSTTGSALIETSEFAYIGDDAFAFAGGFTKLTSSVISTTNVQFTQASPLINHTQNANDVFEFNDATTLTPLGAPQLGTWSQSCAGGSCPASGTWTMDVTFASPISALTPYIGGSPIVGRMPLYANPNVIFRDNCVHDMIGSLKFTGATNFQAINNTFGNMYFPAIIGSWWPSGTGSTPTGGYGNGIISGNRIVSANQGEQDTDWLGNSTRGLLTGVPTAAIEMNSIANTGFAPVPGTGSGFTGYPISSMVVSYNFISNVPGLAIFASSVDRLGIGGNTIVDANTVAFTPGYNASFCGASSVGLPIVVTPVCPNFVAAQQSIMATHSTNVDTTSKPNIFLGTTIPGVFLDTILNNQMTGMLIH